MSENGESEGSPGRKGASNYRKRFLVLAGSFIGVAATAIGIIAAFFPDLLNMQKSAISELSLQVSRESDAQTISDFLEKNPNALVKIDISICSSLETRCSSIRQEEKSLVFADVPDGEECPDGNGDGGTIFNFYNSGESASAPNPWGWSKFEPCETGAGEGVSRVAGYYIVPGGSGFGMGWVEWMLTPVSEKDVLLKNY